MMIRRIWSVLSFRWYMGYWPTQKNLPRALTEGWVICIDEMPMTRSMMDAYIDPVIQVEIDRFLADVLE